MARPLPRLWTMQTKISMKTFSCALLFAASALSGCSTDKKADAAQPAPRKEGSVDPRPVVVETPSEAYRAVSVTAGARLTGTVEFAGALPPDSIINVPPSTQGCGQLTSVRTVERSGTKVGEAVVWLADIRAGKPLPIERRFELANEGCLLTPRVQAVFAPGTLNMASQDVAMHTNHIIDVATGELAGIAPFNDNGEVVPFDRLITRPSQLEITCQLHPWAKAWILVFDHPYFAVTERNGSFTIPDIPAGTYRVRAWHPKLGLKDQTVTIADGGTASVALSLEAARPQPPAADSGAGAK
jgi:hypothetical protein